jgi:hypothetical protein
MLASIAWWGWLLIAMVCWYVAMMMGVWTYKGSIGAWIIRIAFVAATVLSALLGVIRFAKWVWHG